MSNQRRHPGSDQLDRQRAGLSIGDPAETAELEDHLRSCPQCRQKLAGWDRLRDLLTDPAQQEMLIHTRLQIARANALRAPETAGRRFLPPALAIAASVVLGVSLLLWQPWSPTGTPSDQVAQHQDPATPDLYEDLEFYIWLAGHQESAVPVENSDATTS